MEMQNLKDQVTKVFTPARLKKAAALAVLVGIVSAGGAYYHHGQAKARSVAEKQARSEMVAAQAEQRGIVLLDEAKVRSIAAEAIGKSESELDFRSVYLTAKDHNRDGKYHKNHRDGKHDAWHDGAHDGKHYDGEHRDGRYMHDRDEHPGMMPQAAPAQATDAANGQPAARPMFHPTYKVKCYAGSVEYKLRIDAVTGTVLSSDVDVDDDIF